MGKTLHGTTHREKWWGTLGSFAGIFATLVLSAWIAGPGLAVPMVASMGASAVLLFAAPHSPLAQPWNTLGGHLVSALVGVVTARLLADASIPIAAAVSVSVAILCMQYLGCIHPPGGATAVFAVMGGAKVRALGFGYVVMPVGINVLVILSVALVFGRMSKIRRYPHVAALAPAARRSGARPPIDHDDLVHALSKLDTFIDVDEGDLLEIYRLATGHHADSAVEARLRPGQRTGTAG